MLFDMLKNGINVAVQVYDAMIDDITVAIKVYDAINENEELPNIDYPDSDASKAIIEFHACSIFVFNLISDFI